MTKVNPSNEIEKKSDIIPRDVFKPDIISLLIVKYQNISMNFLSHCKSKHKQVKWNKITWDMCKSDNIFPFWQSSTLSKWLLKFISW